VLVSTLTLVLGDQSSTDLSVLAGIDAAEDVLLVLEVHEERRYARHHQQKIVRFLRAMWNFAQKQRERCLQVDYIAQGDCDDLAVITSGAQRGSVTLSLSRMRC
jgi:deoxyribodipyrimidine photolyase-related protein